MVERRQFLFVLTVHFNDKRPSSMDRIRPAIVVVLLVFCQVCLPCKVLNWQPMTIGEQVAEAKIVVYGTVRSHYPMPDVPIDRAYIADMDVTCSLKGEALPARINISEAGEFTSCHHTLLPIGGTFITLLERDASGQLVPDEVNYISVAFPTTRENVQGVEEAVRNLRVNCPELYYIISSASGISASLFCVVAMAIAAMMH